MTKLSTLACLLVVMASGAGAINAPTKKAEASMAAVHKGVVLDGTVGLAEKDDGAPKVKGLGNVKKNKSGASARTLSQAVALVAASAALAQQL